MLRKESLDLLLKATGILAEKTVALCQFFVVSKLFGNFCLKIDSNLFLKLGVLLLKVVNLVLQLLDELHLSLRVGFDGLSARGLSIVID